MTPQTSKTLPRSLPRCSRAYRDQLYTCTHTTGAHACNLRAYLGFGDDNRPVCRNFGDGKAHVIPSVARLRCDWLRVSPAITPKKKKKKKKKLKSTQADRPGIQLVLLPKDTRASCATWQHTHTRVSSRIQQKKKKKKKEGIQYRVAPVCKVAACALAPALNDVACENTNNRKEG